MNSYTALFVFAVAAVIMMAVFFGAAPGMAIAYRPVRIHTRRNPR